MVFKRVTKKESKDIRLFADKILKELRQAIRKKYTFSHRVVGSVKWNIVLKDKNNYWDIDYQLLLTKNSKEYVNNGLKNATQIKNDFFTCLNEKYKDNPNYTIQNSTTSITLINHASKYSIDFVIIRLFPNNHEIIRRNNKNGLGKNEYTWNELKRNNQVYEYFNSLTNNEKIFLIENNILPRKAKEKAKNNDDPTKLSSSEVFIQEVNNYANKKQNNRL